MTFECFALRFRCRARRPFRFPVPAANLLRGTLGFALPPHAFAPAAADGPSGLRDRPRPFVLRASHLDGRLIRPGEEFEFGVNVFWRGDPRMEAFAPAAGGRAEVIATTCERIAIPLAPGPDPVPGVTVRFLTPTELKSGGEVIERPEFAVLFARLRERLTSLAAFYGGGSLEVAWPEHAAAIRMTRCDTRWQTALRRSTRTGQTHPLGGFTGEADYAGELAPFMPFLRAARWTGVGRQTVWGKGEIEIVPAEACPTPADWTRP